MVPMTWQVIAATPRHADSRPIITRQESRMRALNLALWAATLAFGAFSLWVMGQVGYLGIWREGFAGLGSTQITLDLVLACTVALGYVTAECRAHGRPAWPWVLLTLAGGSLGLLAYLLWGRR